MPAVAGAASPTSAVGDLMAGGGAPAAGQDAVRAQMNQAAMQVRDIGAKAQAMATQFPAVAAEMQQIGEILKGAIVKLAQASSAQTASGAAVPGGGM